MRAMVSKRLECMHEFHRLSTCAVVFVAVR